jgi:hypothetical protein
VTLPDGAVLEEQIAGGIALWDVSHLLPVSERRQRHRDVAGIDTIVVHHSGALGRPGFAGLLASTRYMVQRRGFPSCGYTYWIPHETERDAEGRLVVYRASPDEERDWHSGGRLNGRGVAIALQGSTTARPLSWSHEEGLEALIPWLVERHSIVMPEGLCWHSDAERRGGRPKAACPGRHAEAWLRGYVRGLVRPAPMDLRSPTA